ncbi:PREDICTED: cytosolic 5'-nucleotidase 3-like isoform X1 [Branchiostoma belcheri]|uniref:5'-nucleotidase n=1 Tax=Branchiostoma belcheri TaxID=7741 RepID=A0A6P4XNJ9_BRABE|nr:PREDICTED: cytosolic 5'-nucleotidase 3-like isoform X1 [Branchiostoma belcheri]
MARTSGWNTTAAVVTGAACALAGAALAGYLLSGRRPKKRTKIIEMVKIYKVMSCFSQMEELQKENVYIKDAERVEKLLCQLIQDGKSKLQIITDFDMTLSRFSINGKRCATCHNVLENSSLVPESKKQVLDELRDTYYPIEINAKMTIEEKIPFMMEWWTKAQSTIVACNFRREDLTRAVRESNAMLRDGCDWQFSTLHEHKVPMLIFSAGIGDILEEIIKQHSQMYANMRVVSNYMDFNHDGMLVGFKGDLVHTYNKNEGALRNSDYFTTLKDRRNIILMGDSMGDLRMADGVPNMQHILKIGFLNDNIEERLEKYKEAYDIVLVSDSTMDVPNAILKKIL